MLQYEVVAIFDPNAGEEANKAQIAKLEDVVRKNGGEVVSTDVWGKRRMAFAIDRRRDGYYVLVNFMADPVGQVLPELNRHLRISEEVLRSLVTRAVVGKSKGDPQLMEQYAAARAAASREWSGGRGRGPGGPRYDRRDDRGPAPSAAPAPAAAPAAPAAPAEAPAS